MTERIWQPIGIGPMTIKHRIGMAPHSQAYGENGVPGDRHVAYYRERAQGGSAFLGSEYTNATRHTMGPYPGMLGALDTSSIRHWRRLADAVHEFDCKWIVELFNPGVHDNGRLFIDDWHPVYSVSRVTSPILRQVPVVMDKGVLTEMRTDFAQSARNVVAAGADAIEVQAAHSYLLGQFLSPAYNRRTDEYGGSAANRVRFVREVVEDIRAAVGSDVAMGIRISYDEMLEHGGITPDHSDEYLEILAETGLLDYFSISCAGYHNMHRMVPPMGGESDGFLAPHGRRAKAVIAGRGKVFLVGKIRSTALAEKILQEEAADVVTMVRAQIADPFLLQKSREGRVEDVVRCVGAMECMREEPMVCAVNPAVGREARWGAGTIVRARQQRKVVVVGGGPAGMRVAATAARRGHDVVLLEKQERLGGALNMLRRLPTREEWGDMIDDLARPLHQVGVDVRLGVTATRDLIERERPDVVVASTGSRWDRTGYSNTYRPERDALPGAEQDHVLDLGTALQCALDDPASLGHRIVVLDESGLYSPLGLAEITALAGSEVHVLSPHNVIGHVVWATYAAPALLARLADLPVQLVAQHFVESIDGRSVSYYNVHGGAGKAIDDVDTVVLSMLRSPVLQIVEELEDGPWELHRIGDALAPREPTEAIYEGERLGREL